MLAISRTTSPRSKVMVAGSIHWITKKLATAVSRMLPMLPRFRAAITLSESLLMRTKKVPTMLKRMPRPAIRIGSRIGAMPPKSSWLTTSRPSTMVLRMVAT